jgi:hypothetical protein
VSCGREGFQARARLMGIDSTGPGPKSGSGSGSGSGRSSVNEWQRPCMHRKQLLSLALSP